MNHSDSLHEPVEYLTATALEDPSAYIDEQSAIGSTCSVNELSQVFDQKDLSNSSSADDVRVLPNENTYTFNQMMPEAILSHQDHQQAQGGVCSVLLFSVFFFFSN